MDRRRTRRSRACWSKVTKHDVFEMEGNLPSLALRAGALLLVVIYFAEARAAARVQRAKDATVVRALLRLPGIDLSSKPEAKAALLRHLETIRGSEQYVEIAEKFKLRDVKEELLRLAVEQAESTLGVKAAGVLVKLE